MQHAAREQPTRSPRRTVLPRGAGVALAALLGAGGLLAQETAAIVWMKDIGAAEKAAAASGKPMLLVFR